MRERGEEEEENGGGGARTKRAWEQHHGRSHI
jgi:hypothetical protein